VWSTSWLDPWPAPDRPCCISWIGGCKGEGEAKSPSPVGHQTPVIHPTSQYTNQTRVMNSTNGHYTNQTPVMNPKSSHYTNQTPVMNPKSSHYTNQTPVIKPTACHQTNESPITKPTASH